MRDLTPMFCFNVLLQNHVTSYTTRDIYTGRTLVVNVTDANSQFTPGYVVRWVEDGAAYTSGEGLSPYQSDINPLANPGFHLVWGSQMKDIIEDESKKES